MELERYLNLVLTGDLPGFAGFVIFILLAFWKKLKPQIWYYIPEVWRWIVPALFGFLSGFSAGLLQGKDWDGSLVQGFMGLIEGFSAMGMHSALKTSAIPYGKRKKLDDKQPNLPLVSLVFLLISIGACAAPCQLAMILSAYEAEQMQCIRLNDNREKAEVCILEVRKRYVPVFRELGNDVVQQIKDWENGSNAR